MTAEQCTVCGTYIDLEDDDYWIKSYLGTPEGLLERFASAVTSGKVRRTSYYCNQHAGEK